MNVLMNQDLLDLYQNGKCKSYKEVERSRELLEGFIRAVDTMKMVNTVSELSGFSYLHNSNTNGLDSLLFDYLTDLYTG